jgi:hypothetical protein
MILQSLSTRIPTICIGVIVMLGCLSNIRLSQGQQPNSGEKPALGPTIFDMSPCAPPCWFGLEAGISDIEHVRAMLSSHEGEFWNKIVEVQEGDLTYSESVLDLSALSDPDPSKSISLFWRHSTFRGIYAGHNRITFEGNTVTNVKTKPTHLVLAGEAIAYLGDSATIRAVNNLYHSSIYFTYPDLNMILELTVSSDEDCRIADVTQAFAVEFVEYHSIATYRDRVIWLSRYIDYVSPQQWLDWVSDESKISCDGAISELS